MKMDIVNLTKQLHDEKKLEDNLAHQIKGIHGELHKVEKDEKRLEAEEHMLQKKEQKIEQKLSGKESWGEENTKNVFLNTHSVPLVKHHVNDQDKNKQFAEAMGSIAEAIHASMKKVMKTGPAAEHHKGNILPTHNILKPGAHPKHANKMPKLPHHNNKDMHKKSEHTNEHKV